jgi:hypothetical protein
VSRWRRLAGQVPARVRGARRPSRMRLVCAPMARGRAGRRVILADRRLDAPRSTTPSAPAVDARQGGGARLGGADRRHPGRVLQAARAADRPRAGDPRGRDPAAVRGLDGARRRRRPARGAGALRERDPGRARRPAQALQRPLGRAPRATETTLPGRGRAPRTRAPGPRDERSRTGAVRRAGRARAAGPVGPAEAVRNAHKHASRPGSACRLAGSTTRSCSRSSTTASSSRARRAGMGLRLAALEALQSGGVVEFGEREPGTWQVRLVVPRR